MSKSKGITTAVKTVNVHEAKTHLSKLLVRVMSGEEVIIARGGKPVVRMIPVSLSVRKRVPGTAKDRLTISKDFEKPLPESVLREFEK